MSLNNSRWAPQNASARKTGGRGWTAPNLPESLNGSADRAEAKTSNEDRIIPNNVQTTTSIATNQATNAPSAHANRFASSAPLQPPNNSHTTAYESVTPSNVHLSVPTTANPLQPTAIPQAPSTTAVALTENPQRTALNKAVRFLNRLKWKSKFLYLSEHRARCPGEQFWQDLQHVLPIDGDVSDGINHQGNRQQVIAREGDAEAMFKLDFFEYFVLLEKTLVHLLAAVGIPVSRGVALDTATSAPLSNHTYHHNVLLALSSPPNSLTNILGEGEMNRYIKVAKECRNRWKDVDEPGRSSRSQGIGDEEWEKRREERFQKILGEIDLTRMLAVIVHGLAEAVQVAGVVVAGVEGAGGNGKVGDVVMEEDVGEEDRPLEFVGDGMDLDEL